MIAVANGDKYRSSVNIFVVFLTMMNFFSESLCFF